MKRFLGSIRRNNTEIPVIRRRENGANYEPDSLEHTIVREVTTFCEAGTMHNAGDEYLHLPTIVDAAESSPSAAKAAAQQIHKFLAKPNLHPQRQYNAIMLLRILSDNPGPTFTRNIDARFVASVKYLLRDGQDVSVQQILRETLEFLDTQKRSDVNLTELNVMWKKEKEKFMKYFGGNPLQRPNQGIHPGQRQDYFSRDHRSKRLPSPEELAGRVSEAATSAKLLLQMVQTTPAAEFQHNDMLKEFANRCQRASQSLQLYMDAEPGPDEETMLTLIETNDKISVALSKYQRAVLDARKHTANANPSPAYHPQQLPQQQQPEQPVEQSIEVPRAKSNRVPILSMPKKIMRKALPSQRKNPVTESPAAQKPPAPRSSDSGVSPLALTAPMAFPAPAPAPAPETQPTTRHTAQPTIHEIAHDTRQDTTHNTQPAASTGYQYNPGEFQVENPFADKYSTQPQNNGHEPHRSIDGAYRVSEDTVGAPIATGTYYPGNDTVFDNNNNLHPVASLTGSQHAPGNVPAMSGTRY